MLFLLIKIFLTSSPKNINNANGIDRDNSNNVKVCVPNNLCVKGLYTMIASNTNSENIPKRTSLLVKKPFLKSDSLLVLHINTSAIWQIIMLAKKAVTAFK